MSATDDSPCSSVHERWGRPCLLSLLDSSQSTLGVALVDCCTWVDCQWYCLSATTGAQAQLWTCALPDVRTQRIRSKQRNKGEATAGVNSLSRYNSTQGAKRSSSCLVTSSGACCARPQGFTLRRPHEKSRYSLHATAATGLRTLRY